MGSRRCRSRPTRRVVTTVWSKSCGRSGSTSSGHELAGLQAKTERLREQAGELSRNEAVVQARLRELDIAVLDAEQALTDAGHGDVADALVRVESMRERARGLQALLAEKRRGLERELAAAADEGVVETLVADAGALRTELAAVEADAELLEARKVEVEGLDSRSDARHAPATRSSRWPKPSSSGASARRKRVAGTPAPRRSRRRSTRCAPRSTSRCSRASKASRAAWSTTSRSKPAPKRRLPPRSAKRCTRIVDRRRRRGARSRRPARRAATPRRLLLVLDRRDTAVTSGATLAPAGAQGACRMRARPAARVAGDARPAARRRRARRTATTGAPRWTSRSRTRTSPS